eukprot:11338-Hanusia_phi.AAC.1
MAICSKSAAKEEEEEEEEEEKEETTTRRKEGRKEKEKMVMTRKEEGRHKCTNDTHRSRRTQQITTGGCEGVGEVVDRGREEGGAEAGRTLWLDIWQRAPLAVEGGRKQGASDGDVQLGPEELGHVESHHKERPQEQ